MKIETRPMAEADFELSYEIKKEALGPYVAEKWGWDDSVQRQFHRNHWEQWDFLAICLDGEVLGTVWIKQFKDHWRFGDFYVLPSYQRQGIGSNILLRTIADADRIRLPIRLEYLKWNPVGTLYKRHGFQQIRENDTHYFMERKPSAANKTPEQTPPDVGAARC